MTDRELMQQALEALEGGADSWQLVGPAIDALKAALAEPVQPIQECYGDCPTNPQTCLNPCNFEGRPEPHQNPVAYLWVDPETQDYVVDRCQHPLSELIPVYTAPPQRKPLTEEEIRDLWSWAMTAEAERTATTQQHAFARAVERAHNIKE